jgi:uncharacterized membrane protein
VGRTASNVRSWCLRVIGGLQTAPHILVLAIGGVNCLLLCFLTPPFQVHDEFQHFFRSYELSELQLWGHVQGGRGGTELPSSLVDFVQRSWGTLQIWEIPPLGPHPVADTLKELQRPLLPEQRQFADFSGAAWYSPLAYIPQVIGIAIGRAFELPPLALLFLGRMANALCALLITAWSLKILPIGRPAALVAALLPMTQYQYASVSPDASTIAGGFLLTAVVLRASLRLRWTLAEAVVAAAAGGMLLSIKPVYAPLLLVGLPLILRAGIRDIAWRPAVACIAVNAGVIVASLLIAAAWIVPTLPLLSAVSSMTTAGPQQLGFIMGHPVLFMSILLRDIWLHGAIYLAGTVANFGAFTLHMPLFCYFLAAGVFLLACMCRSHDMPDVGRVAPLVWLLLVVSMIICIQTALYVALSGIGSWTVYGVQGRYFLAFGALCAVALTSLLARAVGRRSPSVLPALIVGGILINTIAMDHTIISGFGLF